MTEEKEKGMDSIVDIESGKKYIYENNLNIEEEIVNSEGCECYIFFSSNGLHDNKSFHKFKNAIIIGNRYEWKSVAMALKKRKGIGKIIYVRDVYEKFYLYGSSGSLSSIDQVVDYLKTLAADYQVTTVGISSGGYMAVIAGCILNAKKVFCISGQFDLSNRLSKKDEEIFKQNNCKYFNITDLIKANTQVSIYYFCPVNCKEDYENYARVKDIENVRSFLFPDTEHAATVYPFNFPDLLYLSNGKLDKLHKHYDCKLINKKFFLLQTMSIWGFLEFVKRLVKSKMSINYLKELWDVKK